MPNYKAAFVPSMKEMRGIYKEKVDAMKNSSTAYAQVSVFLDRWVQKNFRSEGDAVGGWKKLALGGRKIGKGKKRRLDPSAKILQDTGRLKASFLPFANKKNAGIGSELPYSKAHNEGLDHVPKRRILPLSKEVMPKVKKIINQFVKKVLNK